MSYWSTDLEWWLVGDQNNVQRVTSFHTAHKYFHMLSYGLRAPKRGTLMAKNHHKRHSRTGGYVLNSPKPLLCTLACTRPAPNHYTTFPEASRSPIIILLSSFRTISSRVLQSKCQRYSIMFGCCVLACIV